MAPMTVVAIVWMMPSKIKHTVQVRQMVKNTKVLFIIRNPQKSKIKIRPFETQMTMLSTGFTLLSGKLIPYFLMKIFNSIIHIITILVAVASIAHIEFPFRKYLLYLLVGYVFIIHLFVPMIKRKKWFFLYKKIHFNAQIINENKFKWWLFLREKTTDNILFCIHATVLLDRQ